METPTIIPVDDKINKALETQNVTRSVLDGLKQYNKLAITGIEDKAGYEAVDKARKQCKAVRVMAEKICKAGREDAIKTQKAWIAKEKEIVGEIEETESYLQEQQDNIDAEKQRIEDEKREAERLRIQNRIDKLSAVGYALDFAVVSTISDEQFESTLREATGLYEVEQARLAKIEEERIAEAKRIEDQRIENEKESARLEGIRIENEKAAKKIQDERDALAKAIKDKRNAELRPYIIFIRDYNALLVKEENEYQAELAEIKKGAENHWEAERKKIADKAVADAEANRLANEKAAKEKAEAEGRERLRVESLKPVKEKLTAFVNSITIEISGELTEHPTVKAIFEKHAAFKKWAREQVEAIS